jgi:hypothetical protein
MITRAHRPGDGAAMTVARRVVRRRGRDPVSGQVLGNSFQAGADQELVEDPPDDGSRLFVDRELV